AVDRAGFDEALQEQRERSRAGTKADLTKQAESVALYGAAQARAGDSEFLGYETTSADGRVVAIIRDGMEFDELTGQGAAEIVLDRAPFSAEGGGQVGGPLGALHGRGPPEARRRADRPPRVAPRPAARRRDGECRRRRGSTRAHD